MSIITSLGYFYWNILFPFALFIGFFLVVIATLGLDSGIHRAYIQFLLKIFEFCRHTIERKERKVHLERLQSIMDDYDPKENTNIIAGDFKDDLPLLQRIRSMSEDESSHNFKLSDMCEFITKGIEAVVDDEVTKRFSADELQTWNLLTRTNKNYQASSFRLTALWFLGWLVRFTILFPIRLIILTIGMLYLIITTSLVGYIKDGPMKRWLYGHVSVTAFRILSRAVSSVMTYHNEQYKPKNGSVCVANHTSPIDVLFLHCDNPYALVGQIHGGFLGILERSLTSGTSHIFFDRFEMNDRQAVMNKMRQHVKDPEKLPILIFPEGTCINNSAVMMFKKGSFEVADVVYPVAIKYNHIFGDPFWDSNKYGYFTYLLMMMTSWAIVCDVWYMHPMSREAEESAIDFAGRVKAAIARQGGLVDLEWDGQLKRQRAKPELKAKIQNQYSRKISRREYN